MIFFSDEGFPKKLTEALRIFFPDYNFQRLQEQFPQGIRDEVWIPYCGKSGLIVLSLDEALITNPMKRQALINHNVYLVVFSGIANKSITQQTSRITGHWDELLETIPQYSPPVIFKVLKETIRIID